ncbi:DUF6457 domain-containing protein [Arthrobacter sp. ISL-65]|uniref:DUF6457 domain-containing protein n=1 Tax=Arthrobacter sp. ISL-65 TaxID=2819112 RepID=UPI001BE5A810|nr:DUF6457 domain-containing protein [Arthrobacter sp. ISL-65]MBT2547742.1 hypothetical protein [Arthrobacter sp. ISL-65]
MTGITEGAGGAGATDQDLAQWSQRLIQALQILDLKVDQQLVARLAAESSRAVNGEAGPVTALLVGYAAGLAAKGGSATPQDAVQSAADVALRLCEHGTEGGPDSEGWSSTAQ